MAKCLPFFKFPWGSASNMPLNAQKQGHEGAMKRKKVPGFLAK